MNALSLLLLAVSLVATYILNVVLATDSSDDVPLAGLLDLTAEDELVEDEEGLLEVKDDVQLADLKWKLRDGRNTKRRTLPK